MLCFVWPTLMYNSYRSQRNSLSFGLRIVQDWTAKRPTPILGERVPPTDAQLRDDGWIQGRQTFPSIRNSHKLCGSADSVEISRNLSIKTKKLNLKKAVSSNHMWFTLDRLIFALIKFLNLMPTNTHERIRVGSFSRI